MIYKLTPVIKNYSWGGTDFLADFFNLAKDNQPKAEAWFGSHKAGAALIENKSLDIWLKEHNFAPLPYLLKILDIKLPLSIQVHPNKKEAEQGFWRENAHAIKLDNPKRNYKDDNHKPEMSLALSNCWLLRGIAERNVVLERLKARPSLKEILTIWENNNPKKAIQKLFQIPKDKLESYLKPIIENYKGEDLTNPDYWVKFSYENQIRDNGLLAFYFMNIIQLQKGEVVYQNAGVLHAYLRGLCVELMANSDNVLRAGLTNKHIDLFELLTILKLDPEEKTEFEDFELVEIRDNCQILLNLRPAILLILEGEAELEGINLEKSNAVLITKNLKLIKKTENFFAVLAR